MISPSLPDRARSLDPRHCLRCGKCCWFTTPLGTRKHCKHLVFLPGGTTLCRVYRTRLGRVVGLAEHGLIYCCERGAHGLEDGCPLNPS